MEIKSLKAAILTNEDGINIAPQTVTRLVYDQDGRNVEEVLTEIKNTSNEVLSTKVDVIEATFDGQSIFNLKYPVDNYDITKFPIVIIARNEVLKKDYYQINENYPNDDQLLINTSIIPAFDKGESIIVIYHYSNTIFNGSVVNAGTVNGAYIQVGEAPTDTELADPSVYFDFKNSQIVYYSNGVKQYFDIGISEMIKAYSTITSEVNSVQISIDNYDTNLDSLMVYENGVFIAEDVYYTIDDNLVMRKTDGTNWIASLDDPITFDFVVYKRIRNYKNRIMDGTIEFGKLGTDLQLLLTELREREIALEDTLSIKSTSAANYSFFTENYTTSSSRSFYISISDDSIGFNKLDSNLQKLLTDIQNGVVSAEKNVSIATSEDYMDVSKLSKSFLMNIPDGSITLEKLDLELQRLINELTNRLSVINNALTLDNK